MKNKENYLTFEWDEKNQLLEIHGNKEGLQFLKRKIEILINASNNDHIHLQGNEYGVEDLSDEKCNKENKFSLPIL